MAGNIAFLCHKNIFYRHIFFYFLVTQNALFFKDILISNSFPFWELFPFLFIRQLPRRKELYYLDRILMAILISCCLEFKILSVGPHPAGLLFWRAIVIFCIIFFGSPPGIISAFRNPWTGK